MLIVAGYLHVDQADRDDFVANCQPVVEAARSWPGRLDFAITADTLDPTQIRIYERWDNEDDLLAFRGSGPSDDQQTAIQSADVRRYLIESVADA